MTSASADVPQPSHKVSLTAPDARTKKRQAAETRFRMYGIAGIATGILFLLILLTSIVANGAGAFQQTFINAEVFLDPEKLDKNCL